MASFESRKSTELYMQKYPFRRLEPSVKKFLKVIEIDLDRLHQHRLNVEKFSRLEHWHSLNREQINAYRTVLQIKANVREIEKTRKQINEDELPQFDAKTTEMKQTAIKAVMEFLDLTQSVQESGSSEKSPPIQLCESDAQLHINSIPENSQAQESWENLHENLVELNSMIHEFSTAVQTQQEKVDRIDDNIERAHTNVQQGTLQLGKAAKLKAALIPVAGAVIGGVLAGPVGLVAGAKIGGAMGLVGGGALGFFSGSFLKRRNDKVTEMELKNLSVPRSSSEPDLSKTSSSSWLPWR